VASNTLKAAARNPMLHLTHLVRIEFPSKVAVYCAHFQTSGTVLADRALLPLLKKSWPGTLDEL